MNKAPRFSGCWLTLFLYCASATAQQAGPQPQEKDSATLDLSSMNLEDLMNIKVISASKEVESLSQAPAAIYVITGEDIRRGGFSSIPDALRAVPGLYVAQQNAHLWVVAARGFASAFNNKMLALIDGRLVYSPTYGGTWWDLQDPPLEDIDRIEVIRGPGGTLWGSNAVNGVINIITREAGKTQGAQVVASAGVNEGYAARTRYGGNLGEDFAYRIYGTSNDWLPSVNAGGAANYDEWSLSQGGVRFDWNVSQRDSVTFDGQGYSGRIRDVAAIVAPMSPAAVQTDTSGVVKGGHVLGRWKRTLSDRSSMDLLAYCDWTDRDELFFPESRNLCDIEFQHNYTFARRLSLTWGGSVTTTGEAWSNSFAVSLAPPKRRDTTYSGFLQYDIALVPDKLRFIAGSKFEHNNYTGFEVQPQVRAVWTPGKHHTIWAAVSRAVSLPTREEANIEYRIQQINPAPPPEIFFLYDGNPNLKAESLIASELGYRYQWNERFSLDAAVYYNNYKNLIGQNALGPQIVNPSPFFIDQTESPMNIGGGQTHGLELILKYVPIRRWTLSSGITELRGNSAAGVTYPAAADNPRQQVSVQSKLDLTHDLNFDANYYYYDAIPYTLPHWNRVDVGMSTKPIHGFRFSVWGRNLQTDRRQETVPQIFSVGEIRRTVVFKMIWESGEAAGQTAP